MKIAKPLLLVTTPLGVAGGLYEAFRLAGGLAFIMVALVLVISAAVGTLVATIRKEQRAEQLKQVAFVTTNDQRRNEVARIAVKNSFSRSL